MAMEPWSMTTLPMNGVWYLFLTGTGSEIKNDSTTVPKTRNSWLGCSWFLPSAAYLVLSLLSGFVPRASENVSEGSSS